MAENSEEEDALSKSLNSSNGLSANSAECGQTAMEIQSMAAAQQGDLQATIKQQLQQAQLKELQQTLQLQSGHFMPHAPQHLQQHLEQQKAMRQLQKISPPAQNPWMSTNGVRPLASPSFFNPSLDDRPGPLSPGHGAIGMSPSLVPAPFSPGFSEHQVAMLFPGAEQALDMNSLSPDPCPNYPPPPYSAHCLPVSPQNLCPTSPSQLLTPGGGTLSPSVPTAHIVPKAGCHFSFAQTITPDNPPPLVATGPRPMDIQSFALPYSPDSHHASWVQ